jgi:hypothetical protein
MRIVFDHPPNWAQIATAFPHVVGHRSVFYCYGDAVYNPGRAEIPPQIIAHEEAHSERQLAITPTTWWDRYIEDKAFRFEEELLGHRAEYGWLLANASRQVRRAALKDIAGRLAGPLYGNIVKFDEARRAITV